MTNKHFDFGRRYAGRRVLVTGHTGFKGGWLSLWLQQLGAEVHGNALPPATEPSLFATAQVEGLPAAWLHTPNDVFCEVHRRLTFLRTTTTGSYRMGI